MRRVLIYILMAILGLSVFQGCGSRTPELELELEQPAFKGEKNLKRPVKLYVVVVADKNNILLPVRNFVYPHWNKSQRILSADSGTLSEHEYYTFTASLLPEKDGNLFFKFGPNQYLNPKTKQFLTNKVKIASIEIYGADLSKEHKRKPSSKHKRKRTIEGDKLIITGVNTDNVTCRNQLRAAGINIKKLQQVTIIVKVKAGKTVSFAHCRPSGRTD